MTNPNRHEVNDFLPIEDRRPYSDDMKAWAHRLDSLEWQIDDDPETAYRVMADAAMASDELAGWLADKYGDRRIAEVVLQRANRAMELIRTAERDLDNALGAIYYLQTR